MKSFSLSGQFQNPVLSISFPRNPLIITLMDEITRSKFSEVVIRPAAGKIGNSSCLIAFLHKSVFFSDQETLNLSDLIWTAHCLFCSFQDFSRQESIPLKVSRYAYNCRKSHNPHPWSHQSNFRINFLRQRPFRRNAQPSPEAIFSRFLAPWLLVLLNLS